MISGFPDGSVRVDEVDAEHILQDGHLVPKGDDGIAPRADDQTRLVNAIHSVRVEAPGFDEFRRKLEVRHRSLPCSGPQVGSNRLRFNGAVAANSAIRASATRAIPTLRYCSFYLYFSGQFYTTD
jgi:hypothetical protein